MTKRASIKKYAHVLCLCECTWIAPGEAGQMNQREETYQQQLDRLLILILDGIVCTRAGAGGTHAKGSG